MSKFTAHSVPMQNCIAIARTLRKGGESLNFIKLHLRRGFPTLPENAIVKALALARFNNETNYKRVKAYRRGQIKMQLSTPKQGRY